MGAPYAGGADTVVVYVTRFSRDDAMVSANVPSELDGQQFTLSVRLAGGAIVEIKVLVASQPPVVLGTG